MQSSNKKTVFSIVFLIAGLLFLQGCGGDSPTRIKLTPPDPYNISNADSSFTTKAGLKVYIIKSSNSPLQVISRDQIQARYTGRTDDDRVFDSTFRNDSDRPQILRNLTATPYQGSGGNTVGTLVEGFRNGILGKTRDNTSIPAMREGEKRTVIMPPKLAYKDASKNSSGYDLRNDTLRFDIELVSILSQ